MFNLIGWVVFACVVLYFMFDIVCMLIVVLVIVVLMQQHSIPSLVGNEIFYIMLLGGIIVMIKRH
jgi:hypothetical protein